ncbi:MAG: lamin tail domain-containing protein [Polyangiaceae bacterium]
MAPSRFASVLFSAAFAVGCGGADSESSGSTSTETTTSGTTSSTSGTTTSDSTSSSTTSSSTSSTTDTTPIGDKDLCAVKAQGPWSRKIRGAGGSVTLNEIMLVPKGDAALEWIEIANPMGIRIDLSGFRLDGDVKFTFPEGTFLPERGFLVVAKDAAALNQSVGAAVAVGSYTGTLPDAGGAVELWNNAGRLLDTIAYANTDPWPAAPFGSGVSLAKRGVGLPSELAESWAPSAGVRGTPGAANFPVASGSNPVLSLVPEGATWKYQASGAAPAGDWTSVGYDDSSWSAAPATFYASDAPPANVTVTATFSADNYFALYVGKADGTNLTYVGRDSVGDWTSAESFPIQVGPEDYLFVAAWEAPGNDGGPQSLIGQITLPDGATVPTSPSTYVWTKGPVNASPGGALNDPPPSVAALQGVIAGADASQSWTAPQAGADKSSDPWGWALSGSFAQGTDFIWGDTFNNVSVSNSSNTYLLFRSKDPVIPPKGQTELALGPTTYYFRTKLDVPADVDIVQPWMDALIDDGAVFYVNGAEVARLRMPGGAVDEQTLASSAVGEATPTKGILVDKASLPPGDGVLAVEVHQAALNDPDMTFGATLSSSVSAKAPSSASTPIVFNEVAGAKSASFWVEIANRGAAAMDVGGYVIASSAGGEVTLPAHSLAPGELWLLTMADLGFGAAAGDGVFLYPPDQETVLDAARVEGFPKGRSEAHGGEWRYPDEVTPGQPNVFVEHPDVIVNELMYHPAPIALPDGSIAKSKLEWIELFNRGSQPADVSGYQLVDAAEFEIPQGTVIAPDGYLVITGDVAAMKAAYPSLAAAGPDKLVGGLQGGFADSGENVVLRDACANTVDVLPYKDGGRWPALADGGGSSLERRDPRADSRAPEAWAASDEAPKAEWQTITYQGVALPSSVGPDGQWQEIVLGLLDRGEVLIDDLSVIQDPAGVKKQLVSKGTFEGGAPAFRMLGNHRHSEVIVDPTDPANHVLRLVATGPTEHMHNHLELTLPAGQTLQNGATYQVSFRARWVSGSNKLNTRLYFNRLARTTPLPIPSDGGTPGAPNSRAEANIGPTYEDLHHSPTVPQPYEPVTVSVRAADPDGVGGLTLWYATDGGAAQSAPMTAQADGLYTGLVPGAGAGSVVQLYVTGTDANGAASSFPAAGPASRALYQVDDGKGSSGGLHDVRIVMTPGDTDWLFQSVNLMSNDLLGATVIDDDREALYDVGLRLKSSERGRPEAARVGFALKFQPDHPFRGVFGDLMVDRSEGIGFGQRELLINQVMNHAGTVTSQYDDLVHVIPPRADLVGSAQLQLARFGDLLLDFQFDSGGDGVLFEYELIYYPFTTDDGTPQGYKLPQPDNVLGVPIMSLGDDEEAYRLPFILKNNRYRDDYEGLIAFAKVFGQSGAAFQAQVGSVIDVDEWLRAFAFGTLSGAIDNYSSGAQHNGNFYVRPSDGRVLYFPHDLDFYGGSPQSPIVANNDLAKLIADPVNLRTYYGHLYDILTTSYNATYMAPWCDHLGALLPAQDFAAHLQFISARHDYVMSQAPDSVMSAFPKVTFQITTNGGQPVSVAAPMITLGGLGWIDVQEVRLGGAKLPLTWQSQTAWQAPVTLNCGANTISLDARDRHGASVGGDTITVTRTGAGCP